MRASDVSRGLVPLAIVTLTAIAAMSSDGTGSRGLPTFEPPASASESVVPLESAGPSPDPSTASSASLEPTVLPAPSVEPAPDDVLALAGRDGVPGRLTCNTRTFGFEDLGNPTGAEDEVGPEFDILRSTLRQFWLPTEYAPDPHVREVARDLTGVTFLAALQSGGPWEHGPYIYVDVDRDGDAWKWAGTGDCAPRAWAPPGYGAATWVLDPAFAKPSNNTRVLQLLVHELACSSGRTAHGRIGPAYVMGDRYDIRIELLVRYLAGDQDCQGVDPTPVRLRLHEALGDRGLRDMNAHLLTGTGG